MSAQIPLVTCHLSLFTPSAQKGISSYCSFPFFVAGCFSTDSYFDMTRAKNRLGMAVGELRKSR